MFPVVIFALGRYIMDRVNNANYQSTAKIDDRIYNDSKARPVGLAGKFNRVTNKVEVSSNKPLMTPEDKIYLNRMFDRCFSYAEKYTHLKK